MSTSIGVLGSTNALKVLRTSISLKDRKRDRERDRDKDIDRERQRETERETNREREGKRMFLSCMHMHSY